MVRVSVFGGPVTVTVVSTEVFTVEVTAFGVTVLTGVEVTMIFLVKVMVRA